MPLGWKRMTAYNRGDVVLVNFPYTDNSRIISRPALVIQDETINTGFNQWIVVQITSNTSRTGITRIPVAKTSTAGRSMRILSDSVIVADKIATLDEREIKKPIGSCPLMLQVDQALKTI